MPYLHERKIYLNRMKMNTKYFYTTFKTKHHSDKYEVDCHDHEIVKNSLGSDDQMRVVGTEGYETLVACMNLVESKVYLYRENGLLVNRNDFITDIKEYGDIITTSHDGLNFIFKKKNK